MVRGGTDVLTLPDVTNVLHYLMVLMFILRTMVSANLLVTGNLDIQLHWFHPLPVLAVQHFTSDKAYKHRP